TPFPCTPAAETSTWTSTTIASMPHRAPVRTRASMTLQVPAQKTPAQLLGPEWSERPGPPISRAAFPPRTFAAAIAVQDDGPARDGRPWLRGLTDEVTADGYPVVDGGPGRRRRFAGGAARGSFRKRQALRPNSSIGNVSVIVPQERCATCVLAAGGPQGPLGNLEAASICRKSRLRRYQWRVQGASSRLVCWPYRLHWAARAPVRSKSRQSS